MPIKWLKKKTNSYNIPAAEEAARLGVHRTTLVAAIRRGECAGEERDGRWYTSSAAAKWYAERYRHRGALYSQTAGRVWTAGEIETLRRMLAEGTTLAAIAKALKRAEGALRVKVSKLRAEGALPSAKEAKAARAPETLPDLAQAGFRPSLLTRQQEREGRVRLHLHPKVKAALGAAARRAGLTLALFVTRAGLAAIADPSILEKGLRESRRSCYQDLSPDPGVD